MAAEVEAAVRAAFADHPRSSAEPLNDRSPSQWTLIFDCETSTSLAHSLRVIAYQVRYADRVEEAGFAFDRETLEPGEAETIEAYADRLGLETRTVESFVVDVFEQIAVRLRGTVIGHNLKFDIGQIASGHGRVGVGRSENGRRDRSMLGGVSYTFPGTDMRLQVKPINARAAFKRLVLAGSTPERRNRRRGGRAADHRGYFVDTMTLGGAMFGGRLSLRKLAEILGTPHQKLSADLAGPVDETLLEYALNDVQVTWECFAELRSRFTALGLTQTPVHRVFSEASIAKAILREMGVAPWQELQPEFPDAIIAAIMETYYGGRVGCGIRAMAVPGILLDFTSEYPTVSTLMGMWAYHVAKGITYSAVAPAEIEAWLEQLTVDQVLDPATWRALHVIVQVDPAGARLPTRADYREHVKSQRRRRAGQRNVAIVERADHVAQWWTLADLAASRLEGGAVPRVLQALRFRPLGQQEELRPLDVYGDPRYRVDPTTGDAVARLVELRAAMRSEAKAVRLAGDDRRASELEATAGGLKKAANSLGYGVPIEANVTDLARSTSQTVILPDGSRFEATGIHRIEEPGGRFHPLVATLVVSGGRLLLAAAMRLVRDAGGTVAYSDTDSLFVVATQAGGLVQPQGVAATLGAAPVRALSWAQVTDIVERFAALNPYDRAAVTGSILNIVAVNFTPGSDKLREVWCFAIAAKRYCLFTRDEDGTVHIATDGTTSYRSEHGLAHLLSPPNLPSDADWYAAWWEYLVSVELGRSAERPPWFDEPALSPFAVASAQDERAFARYNHGRAYRDQVRPWSFGMIAHVHPLARSSDGPTVLMAPRRLSASDPLPDAWIDRGHPSRPPVAIRVGDPMWVIDGVVTVQSYGDYFDAFARHPESKAAGPDGEPCAPWTRGQLGVRPIVVSGLVRIGKEAGRLVEDPASGESSSFRVQEYRPSACAGCGKRIPPDRKWCGDACRKRTERRAARVERTCEFCGRVLAPRQIRWCSDACRKRGERAAARSA